jgi:acyl-ACP thioesterase
VKVNFQRELTYFDLNSSSLLRLGALSRTLQEAAGHHSTKVGMGIDRLREKGLGWFLNKLEIRIDRYPTHKETIEVLTWFRGVQGLKTHRDFRIFSGGEQVALASMVWLYMDLSSRRPRRIPKEIADAYTVEEDSVFERDLNKWRANRQFGSDFDLSITTRFSDYDPHGHVNNTAYVDYVETLVSRFWKDESRIRTLRIEYQRGIDRGIEQVRCGLKNSDSTCLFKVFDDGSLYASGEVLLDV